MRVLVTGSDGFVGQWLMRHLVDVGDDAVGLDPAINITDAAAVRDAVVGAQADAIVHLAAQASVGQSWEQPLDVFAVNATGTLHLTSAAVACPRPPRVLVISSAEVYGIVGADALPIAEDHPIRPVSPYALSKATAELIGLQAWLGRGLEVVCARPFNHVGPGQAPHFVVPSLARQVTEAIRSGARSIRVGDVTVRRDLTDVRDVVRAYRMLLTDGQPGLAYNVCRGASTEIAEVARRLLELAGVDLPLEVDPARMRPVDIPELRGDSSRLRQATGWVPQLTIDQTLTDVLASLATPSGTPG